MIVELDAIKTELLSYEAPLKEVRDSLDLTNKEERVKELEREMQEPNFWDKPEVANEKTRMLKSLKDDIEICNRLTASVSDILDLNFIPSVLPWVRHSFAFLISLDPRSISIITSITSTALISPSWISFLSSSLVSNVLYFLVSISRMKLT